ncbi:bis(5'-nucleosyl)-tetraphosphatase [Pseudomonas monteilii]|uniref:Bis(5'-nucleosyl)-tetraphosphatase n=1 Tax=Pseudomonas monteilii TaxID=76759 RepID=A0AAE6R8K8_9PSED|nr:hypothetical protein [Pseudomonas monteilii]QHB26455.1 bis(5'-nucleosyl)-tetraphosphatase [Pseudomonas monteilii]
MSSSLIGLRTENLIKVGSGESGSCKLCCKRFDLMEWEEAVIHYIQIHGLSLIHVGQETTRTSVGDPWQQTVAVLIET